MDWKCELASNKLGMDIFRLCQPSLIQGTDKTLLDPAFF